MRMPNYDRTPSTDSEIRQVLKLPQTDMKTVRTAGLKQPTHDAKMHDRVRGFTSCSAAGAVSACTWRIQSLRSAYVFILCLRQGRTKNASATVVTDSLASILILKP